MSDDDLRKLWRAAGGGFHGPHVETGTMPEAELLPFLRKLVMRAEQAERFEAVCHCGSAVSKHTIGDGHGPVEMQPECPHEEPLKEANKLLLQIHDEAYAEYRNPANGGVGVGIYQRFWQSVEAYAKKHMPARTFAKNPVLGAPYGSDQVKPDGYTAVEPGKIVGSDGEVQR
jgi:hypothetical protein